MIRQFFRLSSTQKKVPHPLQKELECILDTFEAPVRFCVAYGSAIYPQQKQKQNDDKMLDFLFGVTHPQHWHSLNLRFHPEHYSFLRYFGSKSIQLIQEHIGCGVYYNTNIKVNQNVRIKYGVVSMHSLVRDLEQWQYLYTAGRLQKPCLVVREENRVEIAQQKNLVHALRTALLLLPPEFTDEELFRTICRLSYLGDFRMKIGIGENPHKVYNIVYHQMEQFKQLYDPLIQDLPFVDYVSDSQIMREPTSRALANYLKNLPPHLKNLVLKRFFQYSPDSVSISDEVELYEKIGHCEKLPQIVEKAIQEMTFMPTLTQSLKGILTAGIGTSIAYAGRKNPVLLSVCFAIGFIIWNLTPIEGLSSTGMHLLGIFISVILSLFLTTYPIGYVAGIGTVILVSTYNLACQTKQGLYIDCHECLNSDQCEASEASFRAALQGFSNDVNWLVFAAFHIGQSVETTRLGKRISLTLLKIMGKSLIGLGYAIFLTELILGSLVPSNTARGGGILMPIISQMALLLGSTPEHQSQTGEFLMLCGAHANLLAASFYPTGMAANPIVTKKAKQVFGIDFVYSQWIFGSFVPGLVVFFLAPLFLYYIAYKTSQPKPHVFHTSADHLLTSEDDEIVQIDEGMVQREIEALKWSNLNDTVEAELQQMGKISLQEWKLIIILLACLSLWITKPWTGLDTTFVAFTAILLLVSCHVLTWHQLVDHYKAFDTFFWLGLLIMLAEQLELLGVSDVLGKQVSDFIAARQMSPVASVLILSLIYFYSMYLFSSLTGHIVAFVEPFMQSGKVLNGPAYLTTALLAYFSTLSGCLTNFSSGPVVIYFSQGYTTSRPRWYLIGLLMSFLHIGIYFSIGLAWWKIIGWW